MFSIVVITYNSGDVIGACLDSCLAIAGAPVVVVDNNSSDSTLHEVKKRSTVRLISNTSNRGFAAAANQGIAAVEEPLVLLLNPDTVLVGGVDQLADACRQPGIGAAGGRLIGWDGATQDGFNVRAFPKPMTLAYESLGVNRVWPGNPVNRAYRTPAPGTLTYDAAQPAGAMLMIRRSAWQEVGGFDEGFQPVWFEDVDFCRRLHDGGYRIAFVPEAVAWHAGGNSAAKLPWESRQLYWYGSLLRYAAKHFSASGRFLVAASVGIACIPRMIVGSLLYRTLAPVSVYSKVMWLSGLCLMSGRRRGSLGDPQGLAVEPGTE